MVACREAMNFTLFEKSDEEKKKLAEYMRKQEAQLKALIKLLEKGGGSN